MSDPTSPTKAPGGSPAGLIDRLREAQAQAHQGLVSVASLEQLVEFEGRFVGKKGVLASVGASLKDLDPDDRKTVGAVLSEVRQDLSDLLGEHKVGLAQAQRRARLDAEALDLTEIRAQDKLRLGHLHLVTQVRDELEDVFTAMGFTIAEGPEVEDDFHNFEALNMPSTHPARSMWDTLYLDLGGPETTLLRTHTSPVQIRVMREQPPPIYSVMPGRCYRRDTADARHLPVFHQIEGLVVDEGIHFGHLAGTIESFTNAYFGSEIHSRLRPSFFPFTEPSAEFDVTCVFCSGRGCRTCSNSGWIELGGCGMVHPNVFAAADVDSERYTGFAFGFGIDRLAQMRHGIDDLRAFVANDLRFLEQF